MSDFDEKLLARLQRLEREVERLRMQENGKFVALTTPLTSTSWDGDARSTTGKTKIDLSDVFGVPAGVKAVIAAISIHDSASASADAGGYYFILSPNNTSYEGVYVYCGGLANDQWTHSQHIIPCDANGDIYYQIRASGTGTMDVHLQIWGWWL